jgi:hypothetical protein
MIKLLSGIAFAAVMLVAGSYGNALAETCAADATVSLQVNDYDLFRPYQLTVTNWSYSCQGLHSSQVLIGLSGSPSGYTQPFLSNREDPRERIPVLIYKPGSGTSDLWTSAQPYAAIARTALGFESNRIPAFSVVLPPQPGARGGSYTGRIYMTFNYN